MAAKCQFGVRASNYFSSDNARMGPARDLARAMETGLASEAPYLIEIEL